MALNNVKLQMLTKHCIIEDIRLEYTEFKKGVYCPTIIVDGDNPDREKVLEAVVRYGFEIMDETIIEDEDRFPIAYYYLKSTIL